MGSLSHRGTANDECTANQAIAVIVNLRWQVEASNFYMLDYGVSNFDVPDGSASGSTKRTPMGDDST